MIIDTFDNTTQEILKELEKTQKDFGIFPEQLQNFCIIL